MSRNAISSSIDVLTCLGNPNSDIHKCKRRRASGKLDVITILENSKAERDFRIKHKKLQQFDYKQATSCSLIGNSSNGNITRAKKEKEGNTSKKHGYRT